MKKTVSGLLSLVLVLAALLSCASCSKEKTPAAGGWTPVVSPEISAELRALFVLALDDFVGSTVEPVAYLATQVVAGTNHLVLCRTAPVVPDPVETYSVVTLYEALDGTAKIIDVKDTGVETHVASAVTAGGWAQTLPTIPDDLKERFVKAAGEGYELVALLSQQVVAGMNYCVLVEPEDGFAGPETKYSFLHFYVDLKGDVTVTPGQKS